MQKVIHEGAVISCIKYCAGAETKALGDPWIAGGLEEELVQWSGAA